jgi:hypothetical protein
MGICFLTGADGSPDLRPSGMSLGEALHDGQKQLLYSAKPIGEDDGLQDFPGRCVNSNVDLRGI